MSLKYFRRCHWFSSIDSLPFNLQDHENIPVTIYKFTATFRNKAFTYKQTVESIELNGGQSLNDDLCPCSCENSEFCDTDNGHFITGDLSLIKNQKLRKRLTKCFSFRKLQLLNYSRCKKKHHAVEEIAGSLRLTLEAPTQKNGQIHSNNSLAVADKLFERVWVICGVGA